MGIPSLSNLASKRYFGRNTPASPKTVPGQLSSIPISPNIAPGGPSNANLFEPSKNNLFEQSNANLFNTPKLTTGSATPAIPTTVQSGAYQGGSIVDYLGSVGQASDYTSRAKLAADKGIQNYQGTAEQNTQLLNTLRSGAPTQPATPTVPDSTIKTTSDGQGINEDTGGVVVDKNIPAAPVVPEVSATDQAVIDVQSNLQLSQEEIKAQQEIDDLQESLNAGFRGEGDRTIPLGFITGRQKSLEGRAVDLAQPIQARAALAQAKRIAALSASKFKLERLDKEAETSDPVALAEGSRLVNPITGEEIVGGADKAAGAFTLSSGQVRYDEQGNVIAGTEGGGGIDATTAYKNYQLAGGEATGMTFADWQGKATPGQPSDYLIRTANQGIQSVVDLLPQISGDTTGWGAWLKGKLPESEARTFAAQMDTLKANITFGSLVAMREASKTGGALGQVSDKEGQLLGSALGALDQLQSSEQLRIQLNKIKASLERWNTAVIADGGTAGGGGGTYDW